MPKVQEQSVISRRPANRPRGYFTIDEPWAKDKTTKYFKGAKDKVIYPLIKLVIIILLWISLYNKDIPSWQIGVCTLVILLTYQHFVALAFGLRVMPTMD